VTNETCAVCDQPILPGDAAASDQGKVMHLTCYEKRNVKDVGSSAPPEPPRGDDTAEPRRSSGE
jgi:hypothetical protein